MPRLGFYEFYEFICKNGFKWVIIGLLGFGSETPTQNGFCRSLIIYYSYIVIIRY